MVERLEGDATTDFGAPGMVPTSDTRSVDDAELQGFQALLQACWLAFDTIVQGASGIALRKGPRGGGRDLEGIVRHVLAADASYLPRLARTLETREAADPSEELDRTRRAVLNALATAARATASFGHRATSSAAWPGICSITYGRLRTAWRDPARRANGL